MLSAQQPVQGRLLCVHLCKSQTPRQNPAVIGQCVRTAAGVSVQLSVLHAILCDQLLM